MYPHFFHFGSFSLPTYGLMASLGMIVGLAVIVRLARFRGLDPDQMWNLGGLVGFSGIVGAKLLMILGGTLDDPSSVQPRTELFCSSAQPWVSLGGERRKFPQMPG